MKKKPANKNPRTPRDSQSESAQTPDPNESQQTTKYQSFTSVRIHRSEVNPVAYNPREIDAYARNKLKANIKSGRIGLVEPMVWNKRTGNLVGGHQRLSILDELEKGTDYFIEVAAIDVDETAEREINVSLNNSDMQGFYKMGALDTLLRETPDLDLESTGFDRVSLEELYHSAGMSTGLLDQIFCPEAIESQNQTADEINEIIDGADQELKNRKDAWSDQTGQENQVDYFITVVFESDEEKHAFCNFIRHDPLSAYIAAEKLIVNAGIKMPEQEISNDTEA